MREKSEKETRHTPHSQHNQHGSRHDRHTDVVRQQDQRQHAGYAGDTETGELPDGRGTQLRDSPMMARLLDALERSEDIGHYGRLTFTMIARFFMDDDHLVALLAKQPGQSEMDARAMVRQVETHDYSPPTRDRILVWQREQAYQIVPDPDDPNSGNVYKEMRFPEEVYERIEDYYEEQAEAEEQREG